VRDKIRENLLASVQGASTTSVLGLLCELVDTSAWHSVDEFVLNSVRGSVGVSVRSTLWRRLERGKARYQVKVSVNGSGVLAVGVERASSARTPVGPSVRERMRNEKQD
jgi:hypothetical protein